MSDHKDMTHRHLRHKLQSLGRRLDELEEATNKLQKSEDELLDLQDKIIQAEGSNSSLLGDVEALRKRLLKIQGKDEEVRKAEDLCRTVREKLEEEESLTKELKGEIERLQRRMAELETLEEAFAKSKSDCSQLYLSLNEEKNLTKKLSSEMETLKARLKEVEGSETKLDKAEQVLANELERLKTFTQAFVGERKRLLEKQREDERVIQKLSEERKSSRIEDELFTSKLAGKKNLEYVRKGGGLEGSQEEDNKVRELSQELEMLKNRLKQLEVVEEDLKSSQFKNGELHEKFQVEQRRARQLSEQVEQLRTQLCGKAAIGSPAKVLENGKAESGEETALKGGFRTEKPKFKSSAAAAPPEARSRDLSPHQRRETKLRGKDAESSPKAAKRAPRTPRPAPVSSDNGVLNRLPNASDGKKASVLSRYPPAANQQKPLRTPFRQNDGGEARSRFPKPYAGSDSESNNSDALPESSVGTNDAASASDREPAKANGSYPAYRPHVAPPADHASDSQSSASETESTGSRPSEAEPETRTAASGYARYVHDSLSGGSFDEEPHAARHPAPASVEIQRVCSPREALTSKAVIKPAIVEIDRKELMLSDAVSAANGKPKISSKPTVTTTSKMTSSITIYPSDPSSSRTSSRSSSVSSEPLPVKERHTSTSNILIGPSSDHRGSISVPYEISIPKSEIALRSCQDQDCGDDDRSDFPTRSKLHGASRGETNTTSSTSSRLASHQRTGAGSRRRSSDNAFADFNDTESGFESGSSSTTTVTSWRSSQRQTERPQDDTLSDMKNVTVRSTWRNRGGASVDEAGGGRLGGKASMDGGSEDEAEAATTWRAYRATTFDSEEAANNAAQRGTKHAEVYMRRYNSATSAKEAEEPALRRERSSESPTMDAGILGRTIPHAPVTSQSWSRSYSQQPPAKDNLVAAPNHCLSPASWRRQQHLGSSYDRPTKTAGALSRGGELWSGRGQASGSRTEGRAGAGSRAWSQSEHR